MTRPNASDASPKLGRIPTHLAPKLDKHLLAYAAAASAAGIGFLAMTQSAEAEIVYTAANVNIVANQGGVNLDLNNDGIADFILSFNFFDGVRHPEGAFSSALVIYPLQARNEVWGFLSAKGAECAAALPAGVKVGTNGNVFKTNALPLWEAAGSYTRGATEHCPWNSLHRGAFLGLKFVINHENHYGWAHVTVGLNGTVLNGYAYETVPNQWIKTGKTSGPVSTADFGPAPVPLPQPATLGMLAQGSRGLSIWRRPEDERNHSQKLA